jgi:hypothetical protein
MHYYGDEDFDMFDDVAYAADYIGDFCAKWGRIQVRQTKEKYGTVRVYCSITCNSLHELLKPGWLHMGWTGISKPEWLRRLVYRVLVYPLFPKWLRPAIYAYQCAIYRKAYERALKKYPKIKAEILACPDWPELLEGLE